MTSHGTPDPDAPGPAHPGKQPMTSHGTPDPDAPGSVRPADMPEGSR
jgi:hypothetical protein